MPSVILALGSNINGPWGTPSATIDHAVYLIQQQIGNIRYKSNKYASAPTGVVRQGRFVNAAVLVNVHLDPSRLLKRLKVIENEAGRRSLGSRRWGARPLDIDLIDFAGRVNRWYRPAAASRPGRAPAFLILPHPYAHLRDFVLAPLLEVSPFWWHPTLRLAGRTVLARVGKSRGLQLLD